MRENIFLCVSFFITQDSRVCIDLHIPRDAADGYFSRGEPIPMAMPDLTAANAVQGTVQIVESDNVGFQTKVDVPSA